MIYAATHKPVEPPIFDIFILIHIQPIVQILELEGNSS